MDAYIINNQIKNEIDQGRDVTHILFVRTFKIDNDIIKNTFSKIVNKPITKVVQGQEVTITWKTSKIHMWLSENPTSAFYYCDSPFPNKYVLEHTKILLKETDLTFLLVNPVLDIAPDPDQLDDLTT